VAQLEQMHRSGPTVFGRALDPDADHRVRTEHSGQTGKAARLIGQLDPNHWTAGAVDDRSGQGVLVGVDTSEHHAEESPSQAQVPLPG
jgi:hypothetical protein